MNTVLDLSCRHPWSSRKYSLYTYYICLRCTVLQSLDCLPDAQMLKECLGIAENKLCGKNIIAFLYLHVWIILKHASCLRGSLKLERIESRYTRKCTQLRLKSFFPVQYVFVISYKRFA